MRVTKHQIRRKNKKYATKKHGKRRHGKMMRGGRKLTDAEKDHLRVALFAALSAGGVGISLITAEQLLPESVKNLYLLINQLAGITLQVFGTAAAVTMEGTGLFQTAVKAAIKLILYVNSSCPQIKWMAAGVAIKESGIVGRIADVFNSVTGTENATIKDYAEGAYRRFGTAVGGIVETLLAIIEYIYDTFGNLRDPREYLSGIRSFGIGSIAALKGIITRNLQPTCPDPTETSKTIELNDKIINNEIDGLDNPVVAAGNARYLANLAEFEERVRSPEFQEHLAEAKKGSRYNRGFSEPTTTRRSGKVPHKTGKDARRHNPYAGGRKKPKTKRRKA